MFVALALASALTGCVEPPTTKRTVPNDEHWAYRPLIAPQVPDAPNTSWARTPIDAFVGARLHAHGLVPAAESEPRALLRRVTLALTGLPPLPAEVAAFAAAPTDAAYSAYVDRLLADPSYGEHRARYWLDAVRYADTHGYHYDNYRSIWPYRDYVVRSFNADKPFDQFATEQLAGDLLPSSSVEQRVATGFVRCAPSTNEGGLIDAEYEALYAHDRVDTLGAVFLGTTLSCAACHDHKYDPVIQRDFYALSAFFRNTTQPAGDGNAADAPPSLLLDDGSSTLIAGEKPGPATAAILERGRYDAPGEVVGAETPAFLPPMDAAAPRNRLGLAQWLFAPENPLTTRVVVNRFWSELFGSGLVRTSADFGRMGEAPRHSELLDWLAFEFRTSGFSVKHLLRTIVLSSAYRQSAAPPPNSLRIDPDNRLLSRGPRFRMDGEMFRDLALSTSGLLVFKLGGPSVKPYQPPNVWEVVSILGSNTETYVQDHGESLYRRSLYTFWKRQAPPPALEIFNAPTREHPVVQRERTNTPLQALVTLNDVQFVEAARVLAEGALKSNTDTTARANHMAELVLSRPLSRQELAVLTQNLDTQRARYDSAPELARELVHVGETPPAADLAEPELAAWTMLAQVFLNLDEALNQ